MNPDSHFSRADVDDAQFSPSTGPAHRPDHVGGTSARTQEDFVMEIVMAMSAAEKPMSIFQHPFPSRVQGENGVNVVKGKAQK